MGYKLTDEQQNIVNTVHNDENVIKINAYAGSGKAQPMYSKILTDDGWKTMRDIKIGDNVASSDGTFSKVVGIFPRGKMDIYRVYFNNGDYVDCTEDHLWTTKTDSERFRKKEGQVRTTKQIIETLYSSNKTGSRIAKNHSVPYINPIKFSKKDLLLHPYVLGVLIGDGSLNSSTITVINPENDIIEKFKNLLPKSDKIEKTNCVNRCQTFRVQNKEKWKVSSTKLIIKKLELNCPSYNKHIPKEYLTSSVEDRVELLRGLLDTDGTVNKNKSQIEFSTSSKQLALNVKELASS